ncbi:MAG: GNAT family N-acetyltransferase [Acutalibacter sp.]|jgi:ribosomal-protein-alanine N-acetyltransferase
MHTIETERLVLRPWKAEDLDDLYHYAKNPAVGPNAGWKPHESLEESQKILESWLQEDESKSCTWAIVPKDTGRASGTISLDQNGRRPNVPDCRELGYALAQEEWGKGYMTEAAVAVLRYGFEELHLNLITVRHYTTNQRSRRVIEKCGFQYEGTQRQSSKLFDGTLVDGCFYSLTAQEFETRQKRSAAGLPGVPRDNSRLVLAMCRYEQGCTQRVNHFLKVHAFAKTIGEGEGYSPETRQLLEAAALVHDIGIKPSLEKYGREDGPCQEKEGPAPAREMLERLGYLPDFVERVCFLVGHHHTYTNIDGPDYQALVEADFLVNIFENNLQRPAIEEIEKKIFHTATGKTLLETLYLS